MATNKGTRKGEFRKAHAANWQALKAKRFWRNEPNSLLWTAGIILLHGLALMTRYQPLQGIINSAPLIDQDWGLHFHHLKSLEAFWRDGHRAWGYSPAFMAGYPSNTIQDLSVKFFEFAALGLSTIVLSPLQWFKITAFLATASLPWLTYASARNFFYQHEFRDRIALVSALLGTLYWWNSLPREMFFYGMIGFPMAAYVSVWGVSLFYRLVLESPPRGLILLGWFLFAAVILPLHVQSLIIIAPAAIALLIVQARRIGARQILWLAAGLAICALINFPWLLNAFQHRHDDVSLAIVEQLPLFASNDPLTFLIDYLGTKGYWTFRPSFIEKGFRLMLLILGVLGTIELIKKGNRPVGIALTAGLFSLFVITYFGAFVPGLSAWQPLRFKVALDLFLTIGAAYCINQWLTRKKTFRFQLVPALMALGALTFAFNVLQTESSGKLQLRTTMRPEIISIVDWVTRETPREARVLFEESGDETGFVYDGMYLSSFLPHLTGRQVIGGPINLYNDRHHFAEFHSGKLFKRAIASVADNELRAYLRLYNIGAVVAFHPASVKKLLSIPGLVTVDARIGPVYLMKVNHSLSWFIEGAGQVKASANRLELRDLKGNEIVLKYHWIEGLSASPTARMVPLKLADDPIPFIKLIDPPSALVLRVQ